MSKRPTRIIIAVSIAIIGALVYTTVTSVIHRDINSFIFSIIFFELVIPFTVGLVALEELIFGGRTAKIVAAFVLIFLGIGAIFVNQALNDAAQEQCMKTASDPSQELAVSCSD